MGRTKAKAKTNTQKKGAMALAEKAVANCMPLSEIVML
jgi:hypothetical protein